MVVAWEPSPPRIYPTVPALSGLSEDPGQDADHGEEVGLTLVPFEQHLPQAAGFREAGCHRLQKAPFGGGVRVTSVAFGRLGLVAAW
jgi:hypothetical protein